MVKTFATSATKNDLYLDGAGNIAIVTGIEAVLQACQTAAKSQRGEMIYFTNLGVPNFETIWAGGVPNLARFEAALRQTLLSVEGVVSVPVLLVTILENLVSYEATIITDQGTGAINGNFSI